MKARVSAAVGGGWRSAFVQSPEVPSAPLTAGDRLDSKQAVRNISEEQADFIEAPFPEENGVGAKRISPVIVRRIGVVNF
jgi:hypothetical protein